MRWCFEMSEDRKMDTQEMTGRQSRMPRRRWALSGLAVAVVLTGSVLLGGCGGGSSGGGGAPVVTPPPPPPPPPPDPAPVAMVLDEFYEVDDGARLVNRSAAPSRIEVRHDVINGQRVVILREGAADLLHP